MARDIYGTPDKLTLDGVTFRVALDADPKDGKPAYKNEGEATTGGLMRKMTLQSQESESWSLKVNGDELEQLKTIAKKLDDITMSYVTKAGDTYRSTGFIDFDGRQQASGKVELKLFPRTDWAFFAGA